MNIKNIGSSGAINVKTKYAMPDPQKIKNNNFNAFVN